jgi:hypothetical protein
LVGAFPERRGIGFAVESSLDSLLEGQGFEPSVPRFAEQRVEHRACSFGAIAAAVQIFSLPGNAVLDHAVDEANDRIEPSSA